MNVYKELILTLTLASTRRTYCVKNSNALWHIAGHHSLIRWRFVIHGGIDGYSQVVVYLACSTNNKASTVYQLFRKATGEFGVPSRVRSDKGGENITVCHQHDLFPTALVGYQLGGSQSMRKPERMTE